MPELPALSAPLEAAEALDNAAVGPSAYSQADLSRRLKAGAAALRELARLRDFEAAVRDAVQMASDGHILDYEVADCVRDALTALGTARGGDH